MTAVTRAFRHLTGGYRYGVDWTSLDYLDGAAKLQAPVLLFQGTADKMVPPATSDEPARIARDVTYVRVGGAGHLDSWNLDPARYDGAVQAFVGRVLGSSALPDCALMVV